MANTPKGPWRNPSTFQEGGGRWRGQDKFREGGGRWRDPSKFVEGGGRWLPENRFKSGPWTWQGGQGRGGGGLKLGGNEPPLVPPGGFPWDNGGDQWKYSAQLPNNLAGAGAGWGQGPRSDLWQDQGAFIRNLLMQLLGGR